MILNLNKYLLQATIFIGIIDQINGKEVLVELTSSGNETYYYSVPVEILPCEIKEGDSFYLNNKDKTTSIKCGKISSEKQNKTK